MRQLLGENTLEDSILKQLFLQRLPNNIQGILTSTSPMVTIEQLADIADKIVEVSVPSISTFKAAVPLPEPGHAAAASIHTLEARIDQLTTQVQALTCQLSQRPRQWSQSRGPSTTDRRFRSRSPAHSSTECWYHWRFGPKAQKCIPPCTYKSSPHTQGNLEASE